MTKGEIYQFAGMNELNIGSYMMIKDFPCKITQKSVSKTGKHGASKAHIVGKDIFTDKKYEEIFGSSDKVKIPIVNKINCIVQFTEENNENLNFENIYVMNGSEARDLPIHVNKNNEDDKIILEKIKELLDDSDDTDCVVTIIQAINNERIIQCSKSKK